MELPQGSPLEKHAPAEFLDAELQSLRADLKRKRESLRRAHAREGQERPLWLLLIIVLSNYNLDCAVAYADWWQHGALLATSSQLLDYADDVKELFLATDTESLESLQVLCPRWILTLCW